MLFDYQHSGSSVVFFLNYLANILIISCSVLTGWFVNKGCCNSHIVRHFGEKSNTIRVVTRIWSQSVSIEPFLTDRRVSVMSQLELLLLKTQPAIA